jgi:hypothetical protein
MLHVNLYLAVLYLRLVRQRRDARRRRWADYSRTLKEPTLQTRAHYAFPDSWSRESAQNNNLIADPPAREIAVIFP